MTRLVLRQLRTPAAVALIGLAVVAIVAAITRPSFAHLSSLGPSSLGADSTLRHSLGVLVIVVPGLIGVFWGAPLVARELENGTQRLVWTQSVTRTRWLAVKLAVTGLMATVTAGLLSLVVTWWASPFDAVTRNVFGHFDQRDVVPIAYAGFAFVLGVVLSLVIRRTLAAMAATLAVFVGARLAFLFWARPNLLTPVHRVLALTMATTGYGSYNGGTPNLLANPPMIPDSWLLSTSIVDRSGRALSPGLVTRLCPKLGQGPATTLNECIYKVGASYHEVVAYLPGSRYWTLQWYELAIFAGASLVLAGFCVWRIRRLA